MSSDFDSDAVDSDTEVRLWSRIYHEPSNTDAHECTLGSYGQLLNGNSSDNSSASSSSYPNMDAQSSLKQPHTDGSDHLKESNSEPLRTNHSNECDDSDDEPSKSQLMSGTVARARKLLAPSPSITFIDIASSDDSSDDDILILSDTANSLKPDLVNIKSKHVQSPSSLISKVLKISDQSVSPLSRSQQLTNKQRNAEKALKSFLDTCRPNFDPQHREVNNNDEALREEKKKKKEQKLMKRYSGEVSLDLLNSLPGSSNRFKRIRKNSEEADLWRVDPEDLPGFKSTLKNKEKKRYYSQKMRCDMCREFTDHSTDECPRGPSQPTCLLCGTRGHTAGDCSRKFCTKCCRQGHTAGNCHKPFASNTCDLCDFSGHLSDNCPNNWRKYHKTVTHSAVQPSISNNVPINQRIFCCFCGAHGHFAFECRLYAHGKPKVISSPLFFASSRNEKTNCTARSKKGRDKHDLNGKRKRTSQVTNLPSNVKRARQLLNGQVSSPNAIGRSNIQQETGSGDAPGQGCKMKKKKRKKKSNQPQQSTDQGDRSNMNVIVDRNNSQASKRITRAQRKLLDASKPTKSSTCTGRSTVSDSQSNANSHVITLNGKLSKAEKKKHLAASLAATAATSNHGETSTSNSPSKKKKKKKKKSKLSQQVNNVSNAKIDQCSSIGFTVKSSDSSHQDKASSSSGLFDVKKKPIAHSNGLKLDTR